MVLKKILLIAFALVFVGSVSARIFLDDGKQEGGENPATVTAPEGSSSFLPGMEKAPAPSPSSESGSGGEGGFIVENLPLFTEASFFGLIGFALGYFSRKVLKLLLIFVAIFFVGIQVLQWQGIIDGVNWQRAIDIANDFILNLKENDTLGQVLKDRIPTAGALVAGYWIGFKKG